MQLKDLVKGMLTKSKYSGMLEQSFGFTREYRDCRDNQIIKSGNRENGTN